MPRPLKAQGQAIRLLAGCSALARAASRLRAAFILLAPCALSGCAGSGSRVVISEFVASNGGSLTDRDGDSPDWIELFNPDPVPANLADWCLTDKPRERSRWCFGEVSVPPGGYRVVFASGKRPPAGSPELHASFKLQASAGYLALLRPRGGIASEFAYPDQKRDISFGLTSTGEQAFLQRPTPGAPNAAARAVARSSTQEQTP